MLLRLRCVERRFACRDGGGGPWLTASRQCLRQTLEASHQLPLERHLVVRRPNFLAAHNGVFVVVGSLRDVQDASLEGGHQLLRRGA